MENISNRALRDQYSGVRFDPNKQGGHYESYFFRANHPEKPQAFWIRYTIFSPKGDAKRNIGELWVTYFDGETNRVLAAKEEIPFNQCRFNPNQLDGQIGKATMKYGAIEGSAESGGNTISWDLQYTGDNKPVLFLPEFLYNAPLPKAKSVTTNPNVLFSGSLEVNGVKLEIENWLGSENHNWGSKHTDRYAWGQVAGFDNEPDAFFECATGRIKTGPVWSPWFTMMYLRLDGKDIALNSLVKIVRAKGSYDYFNWEFSSQDREYKVSGRIQAPAEHFVGLTYYNPPRGSNTCLNCKIARCELTIEEKGKAPRTLVTNNRAAFEILTNDPHHGVDVVA